MRVLSVVTSFSSEFLISSSHFPFPSSLSSRAAAYLCAPELMRVRVLVFMSHPHSPVHAHHPSPLSVCIFTLPLSHAKVAPPLYLLCNTLPPSPAKVRPPLSHAKVTLLSQRCSSTLPTANCKCNMTLSYP